MKRIITTVVFAFAVSMVFAQLKVIAPNGDVGIGTSDPSTKLEVTDANGPSVKLTTAAGGTAFTELRHVNDNQVQLNKENPAGNVVIDINPKPLDGSSNAQFRYFRSTNTSGNVNFLVHHGDGTSGWNQKFEGNGDTYLNRTFGQTVCGTGFIPGGVTAQLYIDGDVDATGNYFFIPPNQGGGTSKAKNNNLELGLSTIMNLNPVMTDRMKTRGTSKYVGLEAKNVLKVAPSITEKITLTETDAEGFKGETHKMTKYDHSSLTYILINAVKEQQEMIEDLQAQIDKMETAGVFGNTENIETVELNYESSEVQLSSSPNPNNGITNVNYNLVGDVNSAYISFMDLNGKEIEKISLDTKTKGGTLRLVLNDFPSGLYSYSLVVNDEVVKTEKMVLQK